MPVRRRKYFEKNEGFAKCISLAICATGLSVWRSSILIRVMRARSIQSLAVVPLVWRITVLGIVANLMMFGTVLSDQMEEAVEDSLLA